MLMCIYCCAWCAARGLRMVYCAVCAWYARGLLTWVCVCLTAYVLLRMRFVRVFAYCSVWVLLRRYTRVYIVACVYNYSK